MKFAQVDRAANAGRFGEEIGAFGRAGRAAEKCLVAGEKGLTRSSIKQYLNNTNSLSKSAVAKDLERIGLKLKGKSPDHRFLEFTDRHGNLRAKIHPPDKITEYSHLHIYDSKGRPLNQNLQVVNKRSPNSHIYIQE